MVTDASGNGNDGAPNGDIALRDDGKVGKCFEFNGQNAYIDQGAMSTAPVSAGEKLSTTWGMVKVGY